VPDDFDETEAREEWTEREKEGRYIGVAIVCVGVVVWGLVWERR
jgi:hypothetical protein